MKSVLVLSLSLALGVHAPAPAADQTPCPLLAGIDLAHYLGGPPTTVSPNLNDSICFARRDVDAIVKAQVQDDKAVVATEADRRISLPIICKNPQALECAVARKSIGLKSARQGFDVYEGVMQRAPSYRTLSGIGDEAFAYAFSESGAGGAQVVAMYRGSIVSVTLVGPKVSPDAALRLIPELARAVVANIK